VAVRQEEQPEGRQERRRARLTGVDAARGVALLGMMAVHLFPEQTPDGGLTLVYAVASGRSAALFAVLAGVGLALLTGGSTPRVDREVRRSVVVRALLVALVGLVLGDLPSGLAVILAYYGVLFLVALPLLRLRPGTLAFLAAGLALVGPVVSFALRPDLPEADAGNPTVGLLVADPLGLLSTLLVTGYYPVVAFAVYVVAGLAVGRLDLGARAVQLRLVVVGAVLALVAAAVSGLLLGPLGGEDRIAAAGPSVPGLTVAQSLHFEQFGNVPTTTPWWLAVDAPHASTTPDLVGTTGTSLLVLGLALLLTRTAPARRLLRPLAAAGSMTLTLYALHVLAVTALDGPPLLLWSVQAVVGCSLAVLWLRTARRGPLEHVVAVAAGR
jgi:uncharacterized membrane protein YeiB